MPNLFLLILLSLVCLFMAYQDWKYRAISWLAFVPLYLMCGLMRSAAWWPDVLISFLMLFLMLVMLTLYYKMRTGEPLMHFWRQWLGIGDVLFWFGPLLLLDVPHFLFFMISSLFFSLVLSGILHRFFTHKTIPLAGLQALQLPLFFFLTLYYHPLKSFLPDFY